MNYLTNILLAVFGPKMPQGEDLTSRLEQSYIPTQKEHEPIVSKFTEIDAVKLGLE